MGIDSFVVLMLHGNGTNGSVLFPDSSLTPHTSYTVHGGTQVDTAQFEFGAASINFNGTNAYISYDDSPDWDMGSSDFTIDCWVRFTNVGSNNAIVSRTTDGNSYTYFVFESGTSLRFRDYNSGNNVDFTRTVSVTTGVWYHVAMVRSGSNWRMFLDGVQQGATYSNGNAMLDRAETLDVGALTVNGSYLMHGWIDELRVSKGVARWTSDFTPPTAEYSNASDDTETPAILSATSSVIAPTVTIPQTITPSILSAASALITPAATGVTTTFSPAILSALSQVISPSFRIDSSVSPAILSAVSSVISPTVPGLNQVPHASKILSFNPLVVVTNTNPIHICKIDVSDPTAPTYSTYTIPGAAGAKDVAYNATLGKIYVACQSGKIVELDASDFTSYSIINTGVSTNLLHLGVLETYFDLFASTDYTTGEILDMFEGTAQMVDTDIRWSGTIRNTLDTTINTLNGAKIDTDIRFSATNRKTVPFDIRFHTDPYSEIPYNPIARTDFHVWVDGVELTDVRLDTIQITHTEGEKSRATFILARRHDKLNYKLDGSASQITNQNHVQVYIQSHLEFDGYIWDLDCKSETETVQVTAYTTVARADERSSVTISIPGVNEKLHVYHALIHNPKVNNPYILPDDLNPPFHTGVQVDMGYDESQNISRFQSFGNVTQLAQDIGTKGNFKPKQNWTYFWFAQAQNFITGTQWATLNYIGTSPTALTGDTWQITGMSYYYQRQFPNTRLRLGDGKVYEADFKYVTLASPTYIYSALQGAGYIDGSGNITQHFKDTDKGFINHATGIPDPFTLSATGSSKSSSSLKNDVWDIVNGKLGYFVGTAPYKKVSCRSGRLITKDKWLDQPGGLYRQRDEAFDLRDYAKQIAALEYKKIKNINGTMLPQTSADIELFIDGYYYFGISLLKRINIDNTTEAGIYNAQHGFPVSVKTIDISSQTMKITMRCDNQWSRQELLEIESTYPNPEDIAFVTPEQQALIGAKFDPNTFGYVQ